MGTEVRDIEKRCEVPPEKLRWRCDPDSLGFETTAECDLTPGIIGQERAVKAIRMGLEMKGPGYNMYASGLAGTGKMSTIKTLLEQVGEKETPLKDICYVHNFKDHDMPKYIMLRAGMGRKFQKDMDDLVSFLRQEIPKILESDNFKKATEETINIYRAKQKEMIKAFHERLQKDHLQLVQYQLGPYTKQDIVPVINGKPIPFEQLESLAEQKKFGAEELDKIREQIEESRMELDSIMRQSREMEKEIQKEINNLEYKYGLPIVSGLISDLRMKYAEDNEKLSSYLDDVQEHILSNLKSFKDKNEQSIQQCPSGSTSPPTKQFLEYRVNVIVDNSHTEKVPIIIETTPTYKNLFGAIERDIERFGYWTTDFTRIKAGSLLRANGGYIVFDAFDALIEPGVWEFLKRTLKNRLITLQNYDPYSFIPTALKPEPIPIDVKVIMVGDEFLYNRLYTLVDDFKKIFKVKASFDTEMPNTPQNIMSYISFIKKITEDEKLIPFDKKAAASLIEYGVRLTGRQQKISTRFSEVADLIREACYWAQKEGLHVVSERHVDKAYDEKIGRVSLIEDKIKELIVNGTIMIETEGTIVGQVNGLTVYDLGEYAFARPSKITAETSVGRSGVINIEREAKLSGKTHDKGVLILEGYFRGKYAQDKNLNMSASICFEQSYGQIDGDSASSSEVYALISSLAHVPLRQDIAVTGSVNQKGEIQPVGSINLKIEGFYDVCKAKGLTGTQGVIIPALNVPDLMLRKDVVEAVKEGNFHIYAVYTVDEGISILTGMESGSPKEDGTYPAGTIHFLVNERLKELARSLQGEKGEENSQKTDTT